MGPYQALDILLELEIQLCGKVSAQHVKNPGIFPRTTREKHCRKSFLIKQASTFHIITDSAKAQSNGSHQQLCNENGTLERTLEQRGSWEKVPQDSGSARNPSRNRELGGELMTQSKKLLVECLHLSKEREFCKNAYHRITVGKQTFHIWPSVSHPPTCLEEMTLRLQDIKRD